MDSQDEQDARKKELILILPILCIDVQFFFVGYCYLLGNFFRPSKTSPGVMKPSFSMIGALDLSAG